MEMKLFPYVSELVGGAVTSEASSTTPVGMSWQEQSLELGAIVIETNDNTPFGAGYIKDVRHIARRDLASLGSKEDYRVGGSIHIVQLRDHEYIVRVDIRYSSQQESIIALRIHTSMASSPWFGGYDGSEYPYPIEAPAGWVLNAIVGFRNVSHCTHLGALFWPISMATGSSRPRSISDQPPAPWCWEKSMRCGAGLFDGEQREFQELATDQKKDQKDGDGDGDDGQVRGVVVQCDAHVSRVWVLTPTEHDQLKLYQASRPLGIGENYIELDARERIESVEIHSHEVVNAVRFVTNQRTTPWFGGRRAARGSIKKLKCEDDHGQKSFVGFHGTMGEQYIGTLGVVFKKLASHTPVF